MKKIYRKLVPKIQVDNPPPTPPSSNSRDDGLKLIYESSIPTVNIILLHGHGGHYKTSFTYTNSPPAPTIFWPGTLLPTLFPKTRILSYSYSASDPLISIETLALDLLNALLPHTLPIIFIAHSFGGLLLKSALGTAYLPSFAQYRSIVFLTGAILFLGVPESAKSAFGNMPLDSESSADTPLITALKRDVAFLHGRTGVFDKISPGFATTYFVESSGHNVDEPKRESGGADLLQIRESKLREGFIQFKKTHGAMVRFPSVDDEDFEKLVAALRNAVSNNESDNTMMERAM